MPSTVKIRVIQARDLPIMDRKTNTADAFVTVKLGEAGKKQQTAICRKTLNPGLQLGVLVHHACSRL